MENNFLKSAQETLGGSKLIRGRKKMRPDEIIEQFPEGITINSFDLISKTDGTVYPVFTFAESPDSYVNGGALIANVINGWILDYAGDVDGACSALADVGGVKFKLSKRRTKKGNNITVYEPVTD